MPRIARSAAWPNWIRRLTTDQEIRGSSPCVVIRSFFLPSNHHEQKNIFACISVGLTVIQPLFAVPLSRSAAWPNWIRRLTTDQEIRGSSPCVVTNVSFFFPLNCQAIPRMCTCLHLFLAPLLFASSRILLFRPTRIVRACFHNRARVSSTPPKSKHVSYSTKARESRPRGGRRN